MRIRSRKFLFGSLALVATLSIVATVLAGLPWSWSDRFVFRPHVELKPGRVQQFIKPWIGYGHVVANPAVDYPASLAADTRETECSATLVGPDALLTSGHCVSIASTSGETILVKTQEGEICVDCAMLGDLFENDLAMCKLTKPIASRPFDTIARDPALVAKGSAVKLTGWAGSKHRSAIAKWWRRALRRLGFGFVFRTGKGTVTSQEPLLWIDGEITNGGEAVVENGDSGGAAYVENGGSRLVIGVNQCGGRFCGYGAVDDTSRLVNLTSPHAAQWIERWANRTGAKVCGFTTTEGCRQ
jgi:hypothetical protein